jgi:hypothetical protein
MIVSAKKIWDGDYFVGCVDEFVPVNCDSLKGEPKEAWLLRRPDGDLEFSVDFEEPTGTDAVGALKGVWLDLDGRGVLLDGTLSDFVSKCNECCGDSPQVTPIYDGEFPDTVGPVAKTYTVTINNNGTVIADQDALYAYQPWAIANTFSRTSRNNGTGVTTYTFQSYTDPRPQSSTDTVTQTALVFNSNAAPALSGDQYSFDLKVNGLSVTGSPKLNATSVVSLVAALNADANFNKYGTYTATASNTVVTLSSTNVDYATLSITKVPL